MVMPRLVVPIAFAALLAGAACSAAPTPVARTATPSAVDPAQAPSTPSPPPTAAPTPEPPSPTQAATPAATPTAAPPTAAPVPPAPSISLVAGPGTVQVSVSGIASGPHQVHVHSDCTGNPNLHLMTLGTLQVGATGSGSQTFSLPASLRGHGYALLVYPVGASQGTPTLCAGV